MEDVKILRETLWIQYSISMIWQMLYRKKVYLATYSHSRKIEDEDVNTYDREMLLVELIRKRNQISFDYYKVRKLKKN